MPMRSRLPHRSGISPFDTDETPEFRRHVVPLLSRLGCIGRAVSWIIPGAGVGSVCRCSATISKWITKVWPNASIPMFLPTAMPFKNRHWWNLTKVGKRLDPNSWEYRVFMNWIKEGAKPYYDSDQHADFVKLDVEPKEILFHEQGETTQLKAIVTWSDGSREDVTPLCRFQSNNEQIASVNGEGLVTANEPGDSHVVIFYDNGVVPIPVLRPVTDQVGPKYPSIASPTKIDELVISKLSKLGVVPSDVCTDEEFLRRVTLDMTGTLPTPNEVKQFLADSSSDKRSKKNRRTSRTSRVCCLVGHQTVRLYR